MTSPSLVSPILLILLSFQLLAVSTAQDRDLEGLNLRCCTVTEPPTTFEDPLSTETFGFAGMAINYLKILQDRLGFRCQSLNLFKPTNPENHGFTGFILEMEKCTRNGAIIDSPNCQCDIGVGGWTMNAFRFGRVDFLPTFANDDFRILTHVDNIASRSATGAFFLTSFSVGTWVAIFGLCVTFIILKLLDRKFAPPPPQSSRADLNESASLYDYVKHKVFKSKISYRIRRALQSTLLKMIGQASDNVEGDAKSTRQWVLNFIILLSGLFLVLSYEAVMTASLVQETEQSDFRSIEDLKSCRVNAGDVCIPGGGGSQAFWETAIATSSCHREPGASKPFFIRTNATYEEGPTRVARRECKYLLASGATTEDAAKGRFCGELATTGQPFFSGGTSFLLPKGSNHTHIFSAATLQLRIEDKLDTLDQYLNKRGGCETSSTISLTFERLKIFFYTAFSACLVMLLLMSLDFQGTKSSQGEGSRCREEKVVDGSEGKSDASISAV